MLRITEAANLSRLFAFDSSRAVSEEKSETIDHIQGADMPAGLAIRLGISERSCDCGLGRNIGS